jgi:hypothetical protein
VKITRKNVLGTLAFFAGLLAVLGFVFIARKVIAEGALTTPPALRPWVYGGGIATMWGTVAAARVTKRSRVFAGGSRLDQVMLVIINVAAFVAVAAGFFAAVFNLPAEGHVLARFALFGAATASGALTSRLVIF